MKTFNFFLLAIGLLFVSTSQLTAQDYDLAGGVRFGYPNSLSLKKTIGDGNALEATLGYRGGFTNYNRVNAGLAYQRNTPLPDVIEGLNWYWGVGGSVYFFSYNLGFQNDYANVGIGAQGFLGVEYTLPDTPLNFSIDWVPTVIFGDDFFNGFRGNSGGVGIRYVIR